MPRTLSFTKMEATGNDFVVIDNRDGVVDPDEWAPLARRVSDRRFGIGSDGLILLDEVDGGLRMTYKNPDGSDAGMCGNGGRCFVRFASDLGYGRSVRFEVNGKSYLGELSGEETVNLRFPLETEVHPLRVNGHDALNVYTNTEHLVLPVPASRLDEEEWLVATGRSLRHHKQFAPKGTNVNFIHGESPTVVRLQTYERGVEDLTLACGTGAIASALAWHHLSGGTAGVQQMNVRVRGGELTIHFDATTDPVRFHEISLEGAARSVFTGTFPLPTTL